MQATHELGQVYFALRGGFALPEDKADNTTRKTKYFYATNTITQKKNFAECGPFIFPMYHSNQARLDFLACTATRLCTSVQRSL